MGKSTHEAQIAMDEIDAIYNTEPERAFDKLTGESGAMRLTAGISLTVGGRVVCMHQDFVDPSEKFNHVEGKLLAKINFDLEKLDTDESSLVKIVIFCSKGPCKGCTAILLDFTKFWARKLGERPFRVKCVFKEHWIGDFSSSWTSKSVAERAYQEAKHASGMAENNSKIDDDSKPKATARNSIRQKAHSKPNSPGFEWPSEVTNMQIGTERFSQDFSKPNKYPLTKSNEQAVGMNNHYQSVWELTLSGLGYSDVLSEDNSTKHKKFYRLVIKQQGADSESVTYYS
jgi:hypothetical protein